MTTTSSGRPGGPEPATHPVGETIEVRGVSQRFGDFVALDNVDLDVPAGSCTVILGPSGCGKTTLLRSIAGLNHPTSGAISIGGRDVTRVDPGVRPVGMVFQDFGLYPDKSAWRNIEFPLRMRNVSKAARAARVEEVGAMLQIDALLDRKPRELSGGQRQRVGIGRAIAPRPAVLLMDEPLSALDAKLRTELRAELHALKSRLGMTVLYVTHDQVEAMSLADQLVVMRDGHVEQAGPPEAVYDDPTTTYVARFLGETNILQARVGPGGQVLLEDGAAPLDARLALPEGDLVQLGIRSTDLSLESAKKQSQGDDFHIPVSVSLVERLGSTDLVHVATPAGHRLRVSAPPRSAAELGPDVVVIPRSSVMIFDDAGERVVARLTGLPDGQPRIAGRPR